MGLILDGGKFAVLTDILGDEDHLGDMDFKVAGTENGVTALQMDIKIQGITKEIMQVALAQAREGRLHILGKMKEALDGSRGELSAFAPRMLTIKINPEKIRDVIGKGGATIRALTEETGTQIDISDDGTIVIASVDEAQAPSAASSKLTADVEVGQVCEGAVLRLLDFGAIVQVLPGRDGLLHISEIANYRIANINDVLKVGQQVRVKVIEADDKGRLRLSIKAIGGIEQQQAAAEAARKPRRSPNKACVPDCRTAPQGAFCPRSARAAAGAGDPVAWPAADSSSCFFGVSTAPILAFLTVKFSAQDRAPRIAPGVRRWSRGTDGQGMTGRLIPAGIAALLSALLAGCASSPPPDGKGPRSESMSADQFGQTDFNRTVTLEVRDNLASLYVLLDKLYRRNPREWRKTDAADQPAAVARVKRAIEERRPPPGLSGLRDIQILAVSLDPNYSGDRVAASTAWPTPSSPPTTQDPAVRVRRAGRPAGLQCRSERRGRRLAAGVAP